MVRQAEIELRLAPLHVKYMGLSWWSRAVLRSADSL